MRVGTISISVILVLFSLLAYFYIIPVHIILSIPIDVSKPAVLHPDFFPRLTIVGLGLVSLVLLFSAIKDTSAEIPDPDRMSARLRVATVFVLTYLFVVGLKYLGFTLVAPFFMAVIIFLLGVRDWRHIVSMALIFPIALSYSFWYSFSVIFPEGEIFLR
ncbi:MAG: hypothetical protein HOC91_19180 [Nitrospinaceae bacterium]|jgi:hypothetical protein|nr:hypothetical protein [Nitrospinaceae bacterium]MBT3433261.1 hypothetical protein [Nitrospinaceae bacterium]MBT3823283.1 hypothetical protein [Nitrospinaceae bacterium]MBT4092988.1 hypothetical protein [Nitrospinaceae bacterium]MBT4432640.1 hypothetical protein [Nitrospinaceae bacterium]